MHYTCITRPSVEIKKGFSRCLMENDVKVNIMHAVSNLMFH
jgi:hypothetical protein